jgi:branched-chain amino acid transport system permease protein
MTFEQALQYILAGVTIGSIYAVVAIGFNIIYNATGIINFAQGEFVMLGAMIAISLATVVPLPVAILLGVLATALIGALLELVFIRGLRQPSVLQMVVITIGLSILLREAALHIWDEKVRALPYFTGNESSSTRILGAFVSPQVLWVLGTTAAIVVGLTLFFGRTQTGRAMRACSANPVAARLCGIDTRAMVTLSFVLSAAIGALAGCVVSPIALTQYDCGTPLAIKGFTAAILGGLGNSAGAVAAGLLIGVLESMSITVLPAAYQDAVSVTILLGILCFRPAGLFGSRSAGALREF